LNQILNKNKDTKRRQKKNQVRRILLPKRIINNPIYHNTKNRRKNYRYKKRKNQIYFQQNEESISQVRPRCINHPMSKMKKPHRPINNRKPNSNQRINTPRNNSIMD
jgi:hypothetical protein